MEAAGGVGAAVALTARRTAVLAVSHHPEPKLRGVDQTADASVLRPEGVVTRRRVRPPFITSQSEGGTRRQALEWNSNWSFTDREIIEQNLSRLGVRSFYASASTPPHTLHLPSGGSARAASPSGIPSADASPPGSARTEANRDDDPGTSGGRICEHRVHGQRRRALDSDPVNVASRRTVGAGDGQGPRANGFGAELGSSRGPAPVVVLRHRR